MKSIRFITLAVLWALVSSVTHAEVRMPRIFADNMVLQRGEPLPIWGWANPGESVSVSFAGQTKQATANANGKWRLELDALTVSKEPAEMIIRGSNTVRISNVLVGEVWFCSGQSNMAYTLHNIGETKVPKTAGFPLIRQFKVDRKFSAETLEDVGGTWDLTTLDQSAVASYFGLRLQEQLDVPVGLINASWGGTVIEPWISHAGAHAVESLVEIQRRLEMTDPSTKLHQDRLDAYIKAMENWLQGAKSKRQAEEAVSVAPEFPNEIVLLTGQHKQQNPTVLYNAMVAGVVPYAMRGAIWYQGESNNGDGMFYLEKLKALVHGWRTAWGQGEFPFYLVQLAPFKYGGDTTRLPGIWEAQARAATAIPNTGYTVINDIGNPKDIHPRNKRDVGFRLANQALNRTYGLSEIAWSGPVYKSYELEGAKLRVFFEHAEGLRTRDGKAPDSFSICGADGQWVSANAVIEGESVVLSAPEVKEARAVRFAWDQVASPNLVNSHGLPTGAFRATSLAQAGDVFELDALEGYQKVYEIDLKQKGNYRDSPPAYRMDRSAEIDQFSRVAYVLQLTDYSGMVRYLLASMDAFTTDPRQLAIPYAGSGIQHQAKLQNLTVRSNVLGVPELNNAAGGNIEFWGTNYVPANHFGLKGAESRRFDFDDTRSTDGSYGSMQIHYAAGQCTLMSYNNFNGGEFSDIGIGNNTGAGQLDYTFSKNARDYTAMQLTVFVK